MLSATVSLKGSGSSYGFPEVSFAAGVAERASTGELWSKGRELVDILKAITAGVESNTIVVVEDDPLISHFIAAELAGAAQRLVRFSSLGEAGRFLATSQTPALILLDLFLPDGDGRTLLHALRDDEATAEVPVIVMSAERAKVLGIEPLAKIRSSRGGIRGSSCRR